MPVDASNLVRVQSKSDSVRNICILAHVDHGKTSLSDTLLASNGIISQAMQGQIRYLDSRPDEQERGITMESSAISLYFKMARKPKTEDDAPVIQDYLVNLIDSPGHIDFSSEVTTASRLCDCAVVLVDAVEGVSSQTITVLKQTWDEQLKPILAINKIDRLVNELQMTPDDAYKHLSKLIEQVNAVLGSFYSGKRMEEDYKAHEQGLGNSIEELSDEDIYFDPARNNVIFCSAIDGWGFSISQFAGIVERKLGVDREKLEKVLWGDFYLDPKSKRVVKAGALSRQKNLRPMFVQFILENVWAVYTAVNTRDTGKIEKIVASLSLKVPNLHSKVNDPRSLLSLIFNQWIPVARSVLASVVNILPSPVEAQLKRVDQIVARTLAHKFVDADIVKDMKNCDAGGAVVAYVSKVMQIPVKDIPTGLITDKIAELRIRSERIRKDASRNQETQLVSDNVIGNEALPQETLSDPEDETAVLAFTRVFSGSISIGTELDVLSPKYNPEWDATGSSARPQAVGHLSEEDHRARITVKGLFLLMGRDLIPIEKAYPGNIVGITGLDGKIIKSGTLVSPGVRGPNLASTNTVVPPILRVAIEPEDPTRIPELEHGLELLNISDPSVEVAYSDNGEHILGTAGELHLERCLKDLRERFARIPITASKPVVPYQETYVRSGEWAPAADKPSQERGSVELTVSNVEIKLSVIPLPETVLSFLSAPATAERFQQEQTAGLKEDLVAAFDANNSSDWRNVGTELVAFGPKAAYGNLLIDRTSEQILKRRIFDSSDSTRGAFDDSILSGFNAAVAKGPLVSEPVWGVACILTSLQSVSEGEAINTLVSRRIISATRELIWEGMQHWSPRLMLATYLCDIQAPTEVLGKVYAVVTRRKGRILTEELKEGTPFFNVNASLPVVESFGFSEEIRKKTSGAANPQLVFDGFKVLDQDPYWVPTQEEELEHFGELADRDNIALLYVEAIRNEKGLRTSQKLVEAAERQRNMKR